jgi:two-component system sensor histidine kinase BaeS
VRLVHQTFLVLLVAVLVAVAAMAALFAIGLERGFVDYVNARQAEQLDSLQAQLVEEIRRGASLERIARNPRIWRRMLARSAAPDHLDPAAEPEDPSAPPPRLRDRPPRPDALPLGPPPRRGAPGPLARGDAPPRPDGEDRPVLPPADPLGLNARVELLDAAREPVLARRPPPNAETAIDRAIVVDGRTAAWIRSWPVRHVDRPEDVEFLRSQYARIGWAAGALLLLAAALAPLVARRLTRPLHAIASATERIARGEFDVRLTTERRDEIGELMINVDRMAESLQRLERSRREWIAEISHELRTPLTVLRAEIEGLEDGVRSFDAHALASLREETAQIARLVDDLHQLALADLGAFPCTMATTDLCAVAAGMVARYRERAAERGLALALDAPARPVRLRGDTQRLEQLLANLLDNSLRYTEAPGRVTVRLRAEGGAATLVVEDSAPGVAEADLARLFEPLYRGDAARRRDGGGSGLGLAIARAIVVAHGGRIVAAASPLGGLAVSVTLPAGSGA